MFWLSPIVIYIELKDQIGGLTEDTRKISSDENAFDVQECYIKCQPKTFYSGGPLAKHIEKCGEVSNVSLLCD